MATADAPRSARSLEYGERLVETRAQPARSLLSRRRFLAGGAGLVGTAAGLSVFGTRLAPNGRADTLPPVPAEYLPLVEELDARIDEDTVFLRSLTPAPAVPTIYGTELFVANGNRVTRLLDPATFPACLEQLDAFQALHIPGVTITLGYPLLDPGFRNAVGYLEFYTRLAAEVKRRGLTLTVENSFLLSDPAIGTGVDYSGLTVDTYFAAAAVSVTACPSS